MGTEPNPSDMPAPPPPQQDITPAERTALLRDTLKGLQEAFSSFEDEEDADTTTELHQNAAEAASDLSEESP